MLIFCLINFLFKSIPYHPSNYALFTNVPLKFSHHIIELKSLITKDLFLMLISLVFSFYLLILLLSFKKSSFPIWVTRKIVHFLGGTYIGFIIPHYTLAGVIMTIGFFLLILITLILFSKLSILKEYFVLKDCRDEEKNFSFLLNTATTLIVLFFVYLINYLLINNDFSIFTAGVLIISWGDTFGEVIGKKIPLMPYKIFNKKTISGSFAVLVFSVLSFLITILYYKILITSKLILILFIGSFFCVLIESISWKWFDNIQLPLIGSLTMLMIHII